MLYSLRERKDLIYRKKELPFIGGKVSIPPFVPTDIPGLVNGWVNTFFTNGVTNYGWLNYLTLAPIPPLNSGSGSVQIVFPQAGNSLGSIGALTVWNTTVGGAKTNYSYTGLVNNDSLTFMGLIRLNDNTGSNGFHRFINGATNIYLLNGTTNEELRLFTASANAQSINLESTNLIYNLGWQIVCFQINTIGKEIKLFYKGLTFTASNALCNTWNWNVGGIHYLGTNGAGGSSLSGGLGEHYYYKSVSGLTTTQINNLGGYFSDRYPSIDPWINV